jgi:hypothetical protein
MATGGWFATRPTLAFQGAHVRRGSKIIAGGQVHEHAALPLKAGCARIDRRRVRLQVIVAVGSIDEARIGGDVAARVVDDQIPFHDNPSLSPLHVRVSHGQDRRLVDIEFLRPLFYSRLLTMVRWETVT